MEEAFVPIEGAEKRHPTRNGRPHRESKTPTTRVGAQKSLRSDRDLGQPRPDRVTPSRRLQPYTRKVEEEPSFRSGTETDSTQKGDPIAKTYRET